MCGHWKTCVGLAIARTLQLEGRRAGLAREICETAGDLFGHSRSSRVAFHGFRPRCHRFERLWKTARHHSDSHSLSVL